MKFTKPVQCVHCGNTAPMKIVASYEVRGDEKGMNPNDPLSRWGETWRLIICAACNEISIGLLRWYDFLDIEDEFQMKIVYPVRNRTLTGLPVNIDRAYDAALKVRNIDSNAFAVLLGRVLDLVCLDKQATGNSLFERLNFLAARGDIPQQLADIAHQLRQLRNIGAHADLGELTSAEVPVLDGLCRAILEYVYKAPQLLQVAEQRLQQLKQDKPST
ncbi:MAG: DUF4145 domain-containing protein [Blastocatellia bacterium]|nr:DUF4145 domain-containing protein [Blastocatellia bacterium]